MLILDLQIIYPEKKKGQCNRYYLIELKSSELQTLVCADLQELFFSKVLRFFSENFEKYVFNNSNHSLEKYLFL